MYVYRTRIHRINITAYGQSMFISTTAVISLKLAEQEIAVTQRTARLMGVECGSCHGLKCRVNGWVISHNRFTYIDNVQSYYIHPPDPPVIKHGLEIPGVKTGFIGKVIYMMKLENFPLPRLLAIRCVYIIIYIIIYIYNHI